MHGPCGRSWSLPEREICGFMPLKMYESEETIHVHLKGDEIDQIVEISTTETPNGLMSSAYRYIHEGRVLSPSFSLKYLGVGDGDTVYVVAMPRREAVNLSKEKLQNVSEHSKRLRQRFDEKWAHKFSDPDSVFERLEQLRNPETARESARLSDIFKTRIESNTSAFRQVCSRMMSMKRQRETKTTNNDTVIPSKAVYPSTDLLPDLWSSGVESQDRSL